MRYGELKFVAVIAAFMVTYSLGACERNEPAVQAAEERAEAEAKARGEGWLDQHFAGEVAEEKKRLELAIERQQDVEVEREGEDVLLDGGLEQFFRDAGDDSGTPIQD